MFLSIESDCIESNHRTQHFWFQKLTHLDSPVHIHSYTNTYMNLVNCFTNHANNSKCQIIWKQSSIIWKWATVFTCGYTFT